VLTKHLHETLIAKFNADHQVTALIVWAECKRCGAVMYTWTRLELLGKGAFQEENIEDILFIIYLF